ncbi:MAG: lactate utilization protein [Lachnospiraceae bacterium]|nr:lactate utilization protein [Lachnospiraceae bacterium]
MDLNRVKENLENRRFQVKCFETAAEAAAYLDQQIDRTTVAFGGSVSLKEMGLYELLSRHNEVWWHNQPEQVAEYGAFALREKAMMTEVYVSTVNGMSADGRMINIDGTGNRLASTVFGHKKVYYVVSANKIEETFEMAMWRARNIAAPKNAQRLHVKTPCAVKADRCYDCSSPERICRSFLVTEIPMMGQETEVILVNESLGY